MSEEPQLEFGFEKQQEEEFAAKIYGDIEYLKNEFPVWGDICFDCMVQRHLLYEKKEKVATAYQRASHNLIMLRGKYIHAKHPKQKAKISKKMDDLQQSVEALRWHWKYWSDESWQAEEWVITCMKNYGGVCKSSEK